MCLYPRLIKNRKYTVNKKNNGDVPTPTDPRVLAVPVGCGECMECRKKRGREWSVRLQEEIRHDKTGVFVTLTFSDEAIKQIITEELPNEGVLNGYDTDNMIATKAVRLYLERDRKHKGTAAKHWLITELGHKGTENIHLHGIIFGRTPEEIKQRWTYGFVYTGTYVNERTINYIIKYATKIDPNNKGFKGKILSSKGMGAGYLKRPDSTNNRFNKQGNTNETYTTRQGQKMILPTYYRNKIYGEEAREKLWVEKLNKKIRWVNGKKIDISQNEDDYYAYLKLAQSKSKRLGYGSGELTWEEKEYQKARRNFKIEQRLNKKKNESNR